MKFGVWYKLATKTEIKEFLNKWLEEPFPKKSRGTNKGQDKWHEIPSKFSKHVELVKTTDNEFCIKIINEGFKGIITSSYSNVESLASVFSESNMKELKTYFEVIMKDFNGYNPNHSKTKSVI